jgi:23S rRNA (pseudouridine1915-N3)-methyltransferase
MVGERMMDGRDLSFLVGSVEGLSPEVRERAEMLVSLSKLTLPHDLARLVLAEQAYRALTILKDHPYPR